MKVSKLWIYPIKSMGAISVRSAAFDSRGFENDRRWMLVDDSGTFLSQRSLPKMAAFRLRILKSGISVTAPDASKIVVPFDSDTGNSVAVAVWGSRCRGDLYSAKFNEYFSEALGVKCRLVKISERVKRKVNWQYAIHKDDHVSFADGYPFLVAGEASLKDLNSRLEVAVPMQRFRPNIVVSGSDAFEEDSWKTIRIGRNEMHVVKPCGRCIMTTVDQDSGDLEGAEPLKTLSSYRTSVRGRKRKVLFGQNLISEKSKGVLSVGDVVKVLECKRPPKFL